MTTSLPTPPMDEEDDLVAVTVRFSKAEWEDYKLIADLWNAIDKATGKKRRHKWKPSAVLRQGARDLRKKLQKDLGDWPKTQKEQVEFVKRVVAAAKKDVPDDD